MSRSLLHSFSFPRTGRELRNRMVLAAMTNKQSQDDGSLSDAELEWLAARARGGFAIVMTCAAHVARDGQGWERELGVFDDAHIPGLTRLAERLHADGALAIAQIFHGGARAPMRLTGTRPWSASEMPLKGGETTRPATRADIERTIQDFSRAAARCAAAGFDGVEVHGAHGYLLTQFLGSKTNHRTDEWGGELENRARFLRRVLTGVRESTPAEFLVGVRLSLEIPDQGIDLDESLRVAGWVTEDGVDFVHASLWDSFKPPVKYPESDRTLTSLAREAIGPEAALVVTGGVWTPEQADGVLAQGADLIGLGRAAIGNPAWPRHAATAGWNPVRPPYTPAQLRAAALSDPFIDYMRNWDGFVADDEAGE